MNFTDVQGTWKQIKAYIDTKISSSGADSLPVGTLLTMYQNKNIFSDKWHLADGSAILKEDSDLQLEIYKGNLNVYVKSINTKEQDIGNNQQINFSSLVQFENKYYCFVKNYRYLYNITDIDNPIFVKKILYGEYIQNGWYSNTTSNVYGVTATLIYIDNSKQDIKIHSESSLDRPILCFGDYFYTQDCRRTKDFLNFEKVNFEGTSKIEHVRNSDRWVYQSSSSGYSLYRINNDYSISKFTPGYTFDYAVESGNGNIFLVRSSKNSGSYLYEFDTTINKITGQKNFYNTNISSLNIYDINHFCYNNSDGNNWYYSTDNSVTVKYPLSYYPGKSFVHNHYLYFANTDLLYDKYSKDWYKFPTISNTYIKIK